MAQRQSSVPQPSTPRSSRWPYWIFVPLSAIGYSGFCFIIPILSWGMRGTVKPSWYRVAQTIALPGMWPLLPGVPPAIVALVLGGVMGFSIVRVIRLTRRWRRRALAMPKR